MKACPSLAMWLVHQGALPRADEEHSADRHAVRDVQPVDGAAAVDGSAGMSAPERCAGGTPSAPKADASDRLDSAGPRGCVPWCLVAAHSACSSRCADLPQMARPGSRHGEVQVTSVIRRRAPLVDTARAHGGLGGREDERAPRACPCELPSPKRSRRCLHGPSAATRAPVCGRELDCSRVLRSRGVYENAGPQAPVRLSTRSRT